MDAAMNMCKDKYQFKVTWEPLILVPDVPPEGVKKPEEKGPNTAEAESIIEAGKKLGIDYTYKADFFPDTVVAHSALEYALKQDPSGKTQYNLLEVLFKNYHTDGENPDVARVTSLAAGVGLNEEEVKAYVTDATNQERIKKKAEEWSQKGVSLPELPTFFINGERYDKGPADPKDFLPLFEKVSKKQKS